MFHGLGTIAALWSVCSIPLHYSLHLRPPRSTLRSFVHRCHAEWWSHLSDRRHLPFFQHHRTSWKASPRLEGSSPYPSRCNFLLTGAISNSDAAFAVPALIEVCFPLFFPRAAKSLIFPKAWSQSPQSVEELKRLKALVNFFWNPDVSNMTETFGQYYGGGPLSKPVGDSLSAERVQIMCLYARCVVA
jgi:hypothetical protein